MGHAVAQLVEALRNKLEGRGFDSRWCHRHNPSSRTVALRVDSVCNRNEHQEYFLGSKGGRCVGDCLEIWEPQPPGTLWACPGLYRDCFIVIGKPMVALMIKKLSVLLGRWIIITIFTKPLKFNLSAASLTNLTFENLTEMRRLLDW